MDANYEALVLNTEREVREVLTLMQDNLNQYSDEFNVATSVLTQLVRYAQFVGDAENNPDMVNNSMWSYQVMVSILAHVGAWDAEDAQQRLDRHKELAYQCTGLDSRFHWYQVQDQNQLNHNLDDKPMMFSPLAQAALDKIDAHAIRIGASLDNALVAVHSAQHDLRYMDNCPKYLRKHYTAMRQLHRLSGELVRSGHLDVYTALIVVSVLQPREVKALLALVSTDNARARVFELLEHSVDTGVSTYYNTHVLRDILADPENMNLPVSLLHRLSAVKDNQILSNTALYTYTHQGYPAVKPREMFPTDVWD